MPVLPSHVVHVDCPACGHDIAITYTAMVTDRGPVLRPSHDHRCQNRALYDSGWQPEIPGYPDGPWTKDGLTLPRVQAVATLPEQAGT